MADFTIHVAGDVREMLQRCDRCGTILIDRRNEMRRDGDTPVPWFWVAGQEVMEGALPGGARSLTGMLDMNPDRDTSDEVDCAPRVPFLMNEGDIFAVGDDVVWLEQAQVVAAQMESTHPDAGAPQHMVMVEAAGVEMGSHENRQVSLAMTPDAAAALADSLVVAARAALEAGE